MTVFRLHIRPGGGLANPVVSFAYCLREQVLGLGWQTYSDRVITTWEEYEEEAEKEHDDLSRVRFLNQYVQKDDLIWTRCPVGGYYLAKVLSCWEYYTNAQAQEADIVNVVRCKILKVPQVDAVPGKVVACFRPTRAIQRIQDDSMNLYSQFLWNLLSGSQDYTPPNLVGLSVFSFLGSEATEDVIFIYLQTQGWLVVPNSRKGDTMAYEFFLIHGITRQRAVVQVKTGHSSLDAEEWKGQAERVFLFQADGHYGFGSASGVECIVPEAIESFMVQNSDLLPLSTLYWMDQVGMITLPPSENVEPSVAVPTMIQLVS